jgi:hypothetical protein
MQSTSISSSIILSLDGNNSITVEVGEIWINKNGDFIKRFALFSPFEE